MRNSGLAIKSILDTEENDVETSLTRLQTFYGQLEGKELLQAMINDEFPDEIAMVSSFGAGSAVLLAMVAEVNPATPIVFLDTGKHFKETLEYVDTIKNKLGLTNLVTLHPDTNLLKNSDPKGDLWQSNPNRCCWLRKVAPLEKYLDDNKIKALITGRKRYQTVLRAHMNNIELHEDNRFRVNPLAGWNQQMTISEFKRMGLPEHPLVAKGYLSIGCEPCTVPVKPGQDERAGRWAHTADMPGGQQKVECGLHVEGKSAYAPAKPVWEI